MQGTAGAALTVHEKFRAAYLDWQAASRDFNDRINMLLASGEVAGPEIERLRLELIVKRARCEECWVASTSQK